MWTVVGEKLSTNALFYKIKLDHSINTFILQPYGTGRLSLLEPGLLELSVEELPRLPLP
jgi:hypothetical protein